MEKELRIKKELISIGPSKGVVIPSVWLEDIKWKDGDVFYLELHNGKIIMYKVKDE